MHGAPPTILAIGTCRIFRPLSRMDAAGLINLRHYGKNPNWWFTHSSGEAVQYMKSLTGASHIPLKLRHLACETTADLPENLADPEALHGVDLVIVELSTFKRLELDGVRLNMQNVWGYAHRAGVPTAQVLAGHEVQWPEGVAPLTGLAASKTPSDEVVSDLLAVQEMAGGVPMMTVDHIHSLTAMGEPIPGRPEITVLLERMEREHGVPFHSTRPLLERYSREESLADDNHYRKEFEEVVGRSMMESVRCTLNLP